MSSPASTPGSAPKGMSSRLLTMKFMQRAAASSPIPSSPTPDEPSPKRQKKNSDSPARAKVNVDALADQRAIQAALDAEEAKRQVALERQAAEAGDTRWVLSFEGQEKSTPAHNGAFRIIEAGYANLDIPLRPLFKSQDEDELEDRQTMVGRRSFARFNKALERQQGTLEGSSESDSEEEEEDRSEESSESNNDEVDPMNELIKSTRKEATQRIKAERRAKRKAENAQAQEFVKKRKKKEVKLNNTMTSLTGRQDRPESKACYICGGPHLRVACPQNPNGNQKRLFQGGGNDGPLPKARKVK